MFHTPHILEWVYEAGFGFKEAGLKLDVTMWVPRFTQSVSVVCVFLSFTMFLGDEAHMRLREACTCILSIRKPVK